jgi:hypothetical protein
VQVGLSRRLDRWIRPIALLLFTYMLRGQESASRSKGALCACRHASSGAATDPRCRRSAGAVCRFAVADEGGRRFGTFRPIATSTTSTRAALASTRRRRRVVGAPPRWAGRARTCGGSRCTPRRQSGPAHDRYTGIRHARIALTRSLLGTGDGRLTRRRLDEGIRNAPKPAQRRSATRRLRTHKGPMGR